MQYLLSVHHGELPAAVPNATMEQIFADVDAFNQDLVAREQMVFAGGLQSASHATVVDATREKVTMHRRAYLPGPEYLGGFWVIRAENVNQALEIAERASAACRQIIEVRPFQDQE